MTANHFTGSWHLISGEYHYSDGTVTYPWGKNPGGLIIYTADGHMAAQIMKSERTNFAAKDHMNGTDTEIREAFEGYQAYYGTYTVNETQQTIDHHVTGSMFPNLVGHTLKRFFELAGNRLTLTTPPMRMGGNQVVGVLVWEKISA
jgi:hypothetical protein